MPGASLDDAIGLYGAKRYAEARTLIQALIAAAPADATAWSLLGYLESDVGEAAAAARAFDEALKLRPDDAIATKGRARMALERAESDVLDRYAAARAQSPEDRHLALEQAEAKISQGDVAAIDEFARLTERMPDWTEGQIALAHMLWEARREDFADHIERLLQGEPGRLDLWAQLIDLLAGADRAEDAARAASNARVLGGGGDEFVLREAVQAGRAGDLDRAEALLAQLPSDFPGRAIHDSIHSIRLGRLHDARTAIDAALSEDPANIASWGVAELVYRALGDERSDWLSGQEGLVRALDLPIDDALFERLKVLLLRLHEQGIEMAGQSVRKGTQTRWRLFDRLETELAELKRIIERAVAEYVAGLPPFDPRHPLLRHRDAALAITGSWSVRLTGRGYHVSHIHPLGLIGSACYFVVPDSTECPGEGYLELGRPPPDLKLDLEPIHVFAPEPRRLVLFPSYFHHGTRPFSSGERLSVAFDVNRHPAPPDPATQG